MEREEVEGALNRQGARVLHLAWSYLHSRTEAEDVLQDVMVQLMRVQPRFESEEHEKAWHLRVAANLCKNRLKASWRQHSQLSEQYPAEEIPEESLELLQAVSALPLKYREVIHLFYYEDATTAEIARLLGKKETTVRSLLSRARDRLRQSLKGGMGPDGTLSQSL